MKHSDLWSVLAKTQQYICFMLVYVAVIGEVLLSSLGGLFG